MPTLIKERLCVGILTLASLLAATAVAQPVNVPTLSPEQLENYQFPGEAETPATVEDLSFGQQFLMDQQRKEVEALFTRQLGVLSRKGTRDDLPLFQQLVDRRALRKEQTKEWQALGVAFGDLLVREFGLHWVSYEDELGASKALRWRETDNFVFPVTVFSKRLQFNEKIDVDAIFASLETEIVRFKRLSLNQPRKVTDLGLPSGNISG